MTFVVFFIINTLFLSLPLKRKLKTRLLIQSPTRHGESTPNSAFSIRLDLAQWTNENNVFGASL